LHLSRERSLVRLAHDLLMQIVWVLLSVPYQVEDDFCLLLGMDYCDVIA
jgi:hypothetical protein